MLPTERRERLVEGEVLGQVDREGVIEPGAAFAGAPSAGGTFLVRIDDAGVDQRGKDLVGADVELGFLLVGLQALGDELAYAGARIAALLDHGENHECVMRRRGLSVSGCVSMSLWKVCSFQVTKPSGGFFFLILRSFLGRRRP